MVHLSCLAQVIIFTFPFWKCKAVKEADGKKWPFFANLRCGFPNITCSGVLIHPYWVLTTAKCVDLGRCDEIRFGITDFHTPWKRVKGIRHIKHPNYRAYPSYKEDNIHIDNIALIKFTYHISIINSYVNFPILATESPKKNIYCNSVGFKEQIEKHKTILYEYETPMIDCQKAKAFYKLHRVPSNLIDSTICKNISISFGTVIGYGAPLLCDGKVYGILSDNVTSSGQEYRLWIMIPEYMDWILAVLKKYGVKDLMDFSVWSVRSATAIRKSYELYIYVVFQLLSQLFIKLK